LIPAEQAIEAIIQTLERDFRWEQPKDKQETFSGLISTLQDMKRDWIAEFFAGTFEAVKPMFVEFTNVFQDAKFRQGLVMSA
jgi:phage tail tape-measure protein